MLDFLFLLTNYDDLALLILRVTIGAIFLVHGISKCSMWKMQPSDQMPKSMIMTMRFLSVVEPLAAALLTVGFLTQISAAVLAAIMLGAIYLKIFKWGAKFTGNNGWEFDLILFSANLVLIVMGAGNWSVDFYFWGL